MKLGGRDAKNEKAEAWVKENGAKASAGTFADAAKHGEIIVIATLWTGTKLAIDAAGADRFAGKLVIDATDPIDFSGGGPKLAVEFCTDSGGETVQRWLPKAHVVKCFNIVGHNLMVDPKIEGGPPDMWIAGNDEGAKKKVAEILHDFGWGPPLDTGGIEGARLLEPMCILWVNYGVRTGKWAGHAFKLLRVQ